jgi:hypothetical protein
MTLWRKREIQEYSDDGDQEHWEMCAAILGAIGFVAFFAIIIMLVTLWII